MILTDVHRPVKSLIMCLFSLCNSAHSQQFEYLSYNWIELHTPTACYESLYMIWWTVGDMVRVRVSDKWLDDYSSSSSISSGTDLGREFIPIPPDGLCQ